MPSARRVAVRGRAGILTIALLLQAAFPAALEAAVSPLGDAAAPWPAAFSAYTRSDGTLIRDVDGDVNPGYADLSSGAASGLGPLPTVYMASDGTNVFFRFRVHDDPDDPAQGGFESTAYVIQLAVGGVKAAAVGLNGKSSSADYAYVSNADGSVVNQIYRYPFTASPAPGLRHPGHLLDRDGDRLGDRGRARGVA